MRDPFVQGARAQRWRSRAAFKLLEIAEKYPLFDKGGTVLDLGAAPGSWSQVAARLSPSSQIIAVDILPIVPIQGVTVIEGDILQPTTVEKIARYSHSGTIDLVLSDMSANLSGHKVIDEARNQSLYATLLTITTTMLSHQGAVLCKVFSGQAGEHLRSQLAARFMQHKVIKPSASRAESAEAYLFAKTLRKVG